MRYYNIIDWDRNKISRVKTIYGFRLIPQSPLNIFMTDSVRVAVSHSKRNSIIQLLGYKPDPGLVHRIKEKKSYLLFNLTDILKAKSGSQRQRLMLNMSLLLKLCIKYKANYIFSYLTDDEMYVRSLKESVAILSLIGLNEKQTKKGFNNIEDLLYEIELL
ncbi:hypothetical protein J7J26_00275 [Candidatus Micrarchaeota archaeon]|nr:hypothetical protein [Candidatus Micrarchaeota archaeon]